MFNSLTDLNNPTGGDWGEHLLNTVASKTIRYLFTQSESVEVFVQCNPSSKLLQGSIDSFKMNGRGLIIRGDFRAEELSFQTDAVVIDFSNVLRGKLTLKQPTQAIAQVTLSQLELLPNNRVRISAKADLSNGELVPISLSATIAIERRRRLVFCNPKFEAYTVPESQWKISETLSYALAEILDQMVDLERFDLDGITMRLNRLETQGKQLIFSGYAQIERIPTRTSI